MNLHPFSFFVAEIRLILMKWQTARREINYGEKTLVMAILNVTPDSFSDGGKFDSVDEAVRRVEVLVAEGADIIDIGGESTRPNSRRISADEEIKRITPVIENIVKRFNIPVSIDTTKSEVAAEAIAAGAEIVNDISGLRFDERMAEVAARHKVGLILMHLNGTFETMHEKKYTGNVLREVADGWRESLKKAEIGGVERNNIALDVGIGFGKTIEQNLELIAKSKSLIEEFSDFPTLIGTSRKSFIGKILNDAPPDERLSGSLGSAAIAVWNGAKIVRVHDVKATVETLKVIDKIKAAL